jgi:hypothetical protein
MKPADLVIARFGGVRPLARLLGLDHSSICRWTQKAPRGGGGLIPSRYHQPLLKLAEEKGVALSADDLIRGVVTV